jgi:hypothetical protein
MIPKGLLPIRPPHTHKGDVGHVFVIAGSVGLTGAATLCSLGALRTGGHVHVRTGWVIIRMDGAAIARTDCAIDVPHVHGVFHGEAVGRVGGVVYARGCRDERTAGRGRECAACEMAREERRCIELFGG